MYLLVVGLVFLTLRVALFILNCYLLLFLAVIYLQASLHDGSELHLFLLPNLLCLQAKLHIFLAEDRLTTFLSCFVNSSNKRV